MPCVFNKGFEKHLVTFGYRRVAVYISNFFSPSTALGRKKAADSHTIMHVMQSTCIM